MMGICYLHTLPQPVIHGDVKLSNALVDSGLVIKVSLFDFCCPCIRDGSYFLIVMRWPVFQVADFGLATWRAYQTSVTKSKSTSPAGTITHLPPESWNDLGSKPTFYWDIYAFALLMFELLSGETAYEGKDVTVYLSYLYIMSLMIRWPKFSNYTTTFLYFVHNLFQVVMKRRSESVLEKAKDLIPKRLLKMSRSRWLIWWSCAGSKYQQKDQQQQVRRHYCSNITISEKFLYTSSFMLSDAYICFRHHDHDQWHLWILCLRDSDKKGQFDYGGWTG